MSDIQKQWAQDVADYGDNAYLLWQLKYVGNGLSGSFYDESINNEHVSANIAYSKRKDSAALPFDLERAKAGDVVEFFIENEWHECESFDISANKKWGSIITKGAWGSGPIYRFIQELRMKYPPKATNASPEN